MLHALSAVRPGVLVLGATVAIGLYAVGTHTPAHPTPPAPHAKAVVTAPRYVAPPTLTDTPVDDEPVEADGDEEEELEEIRGMAPIEDPAELAMVFSLDGDSYVRIASDEHAASHGSPRMIDDGSTLAVIAPVLLSALPEELRRWSGRTVMVDGTCRARVVGFAEVSRVAGEPPGTDSYYYSSEEERGDMEKPEWTIDNVSEANVMLAAKLDGCTGTWARGAEFSPAAIAEATSDADLESAALADLLAQNDDDATQDSWKESGGEGDWREAVDPTVSVYTHPLTGEHWIFASAYLAGGCGEPGVSVMAAYRASADGTVHRVADLDYAGQTIDTVLDVDGDGQPELLLGGGDSVDLVDLKNTGHDSISVHYYSWGCGC
jgi:hypothetical protein